MVIVQYRATEDHVEQFILCRHLTNRAQEKKFWKVYSIIKEYQRSRTYGVCVYSDCVSLMTRTNNVLWVYEKGKQKYFGICCFLHREKSWQRKKFKKIWH